MNVEQFHLKSSPLRHQLYGRLWVSIDLMPLIFPQAIIIPFCPYIYHLSFPSTHLGLSGVTLLFLTEHLFPPWFPFTPSVSGLERADVPNSISIFPPAANVVMSL